MIGPVSETGRNMMASLQQAMSKGMPPDQAIAYVKTLAVDGVAPLADLYSMMMQFQRLKEPTRRPPEGGTIRQELDMLQNMKDPMSQGLGGMNAGVMENPQGFAGGGIVAFQQGGVSGTPPMNPAAPDFQQQMLEYMKQFSVPQGQFVDERMQAEEEMAKKYGLGQYGEAFKARQAQAAEMQRALPAQQAEERKLDRAEFFFNLAAAAADPGATFATSLGKAGSSYTKAQRATNERLRGLQKEAQEAGLKLLEAEQLRKEGDVNAAQKMFAEGREQAVETGMKIYELQAEDTRARLSRESNERVANIYRTPVGVDAEREKLFAELRQLERQGKTDTDEYKRKLDLYQSSFQQVAAAQVRQAGQLPADIKSQVAKIDDTIKALTIEMTKFPPNTAMYKNYEDQITKKKAERDMLTGGTQGAGADNDPLGIR
jgi:hypothetical protein